MNGPRRRKRSPESGQLSRRHRQDAIGLLQRLLAEPAAKLIATPGGPYSLQRSAGAREVSAELARLLLANGLLQAAGDAELTISSAARSWLSRQADPEQAFRAQHQTIERTQMLGDESASVLVNRDESPIAALTRHKARNGAPWLAPHTVTAGERIRRDFEAGRLQPRITANWSATVNMDRRTGGSGGVTDLTDLALAARLRLDRASDAVGPELFDILVDVCCFLKGLEAVERERRWPARSAKLVLRLALEALARHYGLTPAATGRSGGRRVRHWGADGYRPDAR